MPKVPEANITFYNLTMAKCSAVFFFRNVILKDTIIQYMYFKYFKYFKIKCFAIYPETPRKPRKFGKNIFKVNEHKFIVSMHQNNTKLYASIKDYL